MRLFSLNFALRFVDQPELALATKHCTSKYAGNCQINQKFIHGAKMISGMSGINNKNVENMQKVIQIWLLVIDEVVPYFKYQP